MSPPAPSSLAAASSATSAAAPGSHSGARGRRSCGLRFGTSHAGSLGLLPALDLAVLVDDRAELHARLAESPHRGVRRATFPPFVARPQHRLAHRALRSTALAAP